MTSLFFRISLSAILSIASLAIILLRVSPLTAPAVALPFFFLTLFLSIVTTACLLLYFLWGWIPVEGMDAGRRITAALREGIFLGIATALIFVFLMLDVLTWWIAILIYLVFVFIEMALLS